MMYPAEQQQRSRASLFSIGGLEPCTFVAPGRIGRSVSRSPRRKSPSVKRQHNSPRPPSPPVLMGGKSNFCPPCPPRRIAKRRIKKAARENRGGLPPRARRYMRE